MEREGSYRKVQGGISHWTKRIKEFAEKHDIIFFVAGKKSSNGKVLFEECKKHNPNSHFIPSPEALDVNLVKKDMSVGICGATSTPKWQMEEVAKIIKTLKPNLYLDDSIIF